MWKTGDEDIPAPSHEEQPVKAKSNEVRIGPMTRARAKLLEQQVNLFLAQTDVCIDENFILPKSLHVCMIRFEGITSIARGGGGLHQEEPKVMINHCCAREEREACARGEKTIIQRSQKFKLKMPGADYPAPNPGLSGPPKGRKSYEAEKFQREKAGADYPPPQTGLSGPPDYPASRGGLSGPHVFCLFR